MRIAKKGFVLRIKMELWAGVPEETPVNRQEWSPHMSRSIIPIGILWVVGFVTASSYGAGGAIVAEPVSLQQAPSPSVERDASEDIPLLDMVSSALSRVAQVARPSVVSVQTV